MPLKGEASSLGMRQYLQTDFEVTAKGKHHSWPVGMPNSGMYVWELFRPEGPKILQNIGAPA